MRSFDERWRETLNQSVLLAPFAAIKKAVPSVATIGNALQFIGFILALVLFAALPLPKFADDKIGLALISCAGFGSWLLGYLLGGRERRSPNAIDILVLCYFAINVVSTGASHYLTTSLRGLLLVALYVLSYFFFTGIIQASPKRKLAILAVLALSALALSVHGFYQYHIHVEPLATWEDPTVENKGTRIFSTLKNPNLLAGYLLPLVALTASLGIAAISTKRLLIGIPVIGIALATAVATILTGSRGAFFGLAGIAGMILMVVVSLLWQRKPKLRIPIIFGVIALLIGGLIGLHFVPGFEQRVISIFRGSEHSSNAFRMNVWRASLAMLADNWWFGVGPGNQTFVRAYGLYMKSGFDALGTYCVPLEVAVETGLVGLGVFLTMVVACLARGHVAFWSKDGWERWIAAGAAAGLVGMMIHGAVDTVFYRPQVHFLFWLLISLLATSLGNGEKDAKTAS